MSVLPDPRTEPTLDVARAGELLGLGRSAAYEAAHQFLETDGRAGLPCLRFNSHTLRVPTARLLELLGVSSTNGNGTQQDE
jgi:hypothetical protein